MVFVIGVKGHLGVKWGHCSDMLKMLLHLPLSIDFDWSVIGGFLGYVGGRSVGYLN